MNSARYAIDWHCACGNEHDRDDHCDACAVNHQSGKAAQRHSKISDAEKDSNEIRHRMQATAMLGATEAVLTLWALFTRHRGQCFLAAAYATISWANSTFRFSLKVLILCRR